MEEHSASDLTYIEDFLLTYRAFLKSPQDIVTKLLSWFNDLSLREKVTLLYSLCCKKNLRLYPKILWYNFCFTYSIIYCFEEFLQMFSQVVNIVLDWIRNHYKDFDLNATMTEFLENFEVLLEQQVQITRMK